MKKVNLLFLCLILFTVTSSLLAQYPYTRKVVTVPKTVADVIKIDGKMDERAWTNAVKSSLVSQNGYEMFANKYYRESLTEPDYDEYYTKMLWVKDTLYLFIHID
jgi:hypothetical protein